MSFGFEAVLLGNFPFQTARTGNLEDALERLFAKIRENRESQYEEVDGNDDMPYIYFTAGGNKSVLWRYHFKGPGKVLYLGGVLKCACKCALNQSVPAVRRGLQAPRDSSLACTRYTNWKFKLGKTLNNLNLRFFSENFKTLIFKITLLPKHW